tara:strand:+ start:2141 stop:5341 length:3201 start_codon:yes stop_codon:yes gene_type:complete
MSNILAYPLITNVSTDDLLIISDVSIIGNPTRSVQVGQIMGDGSGSVLSVDASIGGDAVTVTGGPITISGTLEFAFGGGANQYIDGQGNLATFPTIPVAGVTQVAQSHGGNAFLVGGSPVTGIGTLAITMTGAANQYIDGQGNLANISTLPSGLTSVGLSTDIGAFVVGNSPLIQNGVLSLNRTGGSEGQFLRQDGQWADVPASAGINQIIGQFPIDSITTNGIATISLDSGWDIIPYDGGNSTWAVEKYNAYMEVPAGATVPSSVNIRPSGLEKANEGYFIFVATSSDVPENFLRFTSVNNGPQAQVKTTWSATGTRTYVPNNPLNGFWRAGTAVKFHYIFRDGVIWWSACCEIATETTSCAVVQGSTIVVYSMNENTTATPTSFNGGLPAGDSGSGLPMVWSITTQPQNGSVVLDTTAGTFRYIPTLDYSGSDSFQWKANNGICDSAIGTVNFNILNVTGIASPPTLYFESNGFGNVCGVVQTPDPTVNPSVAFNGVLWEGYYCDPDSTAAQVTIDVTYSNDNKVTWQPLTGSAFTFQKDMLGGVATDNRFTLSTTNFPAGTIFFRFTITDELGNVGIFREIFFSAVYDFLISTEFLMSYSGGDPSGNLNAASYPAGTWTPPSTAYYDTLFESPAVAIRNETVNTYSALFSASTSVTSLTITPSGGTLVAKYPDVRIVLETYTTNNYNPNQVLFDPRFKVMIKPGTLVTTSNNIVPGDTVEIDAATLNAAFSTSGTGTVKYTISVDDIVRAPLATGPVAISKELEMIGHTCPDGGFALIAWGYNASGIYKSFTLTSFSSSNQGRVVPSQFGDPNVIDTNRRSSPSYEKTYAFISNEVSPDTNITWNPVTIATSARVMPWWNRNGFGANGMWPLLDSQIDQTGAGAAIDIENKLQYIPAMSAIASGGTVVNPYYYATDNVVRFMMGVGGSTSSSTWAKTYNRVRGMYRIDPATAQTLANTFTDGLINFMVVGDTYGINPYTPPQYSFTRPYGDWIARTHGDACQLRIFSQNAAGTNQYEIRDYGGTPPSPGNPGTPFKAADGTYVEINIYAAAGSNATVRDFTTP